MEPFLLVTKRVTLPGQVKFVNIIFGEGRITARSGFFVGVDFEIPRFFSIFYFMPVDFIVAACMRTAQCSSKFRGVTGGFIKGSKNPASDAVSTRIC